MSNEQIIGSIIGINFILVGIFCILGAYNKLPKVFQLAINNSGFGISTKWAKISGVIVIIGGVKEVITSFI